MATIAIVGTAYVEVKAVTDKVRGQVRDGFQRGMEGVGEDAAGQFEQEMLPGMEHAADEASTVIKKKLTKAGDTSGASFLQKFRLRTWRGMENLSSKFLGLWGASGNDSGNRFGQQFWGGAQKWFSKVSFKPILFGGLGAFIPQLIALVGQLGGGLTALASSIGQVVGSIGPLYSSMVPLVSVMGGVKLAMSGVGQALQVLNNPDATPAATAAALKKLTPEARAFAQTLHNLHPEIQKLRNTAGKNLFPGLTAAIKGAQPLMGPFRRMIGEIDKAVGNAAKSTGRWLGHGGLGLMHQIFNRNVTSVRNLTGALTPFIKSLMRIYHAMQPVQNEFTGMIKHGAQWLNLWTGSNQHTMENYFQRSFTRLREVGRIIMNLVKVVLNAGHAASHAGNSMLKSIEDVTAGWVKLTGKVSVQNKMRDYFQSTIPAMREVAGMIGDIVKGIVHLGSSDHELVPLLKQIRGELFPAIGQLMKVATGPLAHDMVQLFTDLVRVFGDLAGQGGAGFLTSFANALDQVARAIHDVLSVPFIGKLAGYLLGIAGAIAAYGKVIAILKGFSLIKWVTGLGTAAKATATEMDALAASEERAALAGKGAAATGGAFGAFRGKLGRAGGLYAAGAIGQSIVGGRVGSYLGAAGTGAALGSFFGPVGAGLGAGLGVGAQFLFGGGGTPHYATSSSNPINKTYTAAQNALAKGGLGTAVGGSLKTQLADMAKTKAGYDQLTAALIKYTIKAQDGAGAPKLLAQYMANSAQAALDAADAYRQAGGTERLMKIQTNQLTTSLATHAAKVLQTSSSYDTFRSQLNSLKAEVAQNGRELKGFSDGAIANRSAISSAAQSIFDHINAMKQDGAGAKQVQTALYNMAQRLRDQAKAAGLGGAALDRFLGKVGLLPSRIKRALAGLHALGEAAGGNLGRGFVLGIQQMQGAATVQAKVLADQTAKQMRYTLEQRSPSKVTERIGKDFGRGFVIGIRKMLREAKAGGKHLGDAAIHDLVKSVDAIVSGLQSKMQSVRQAISVIGQTGGRTGVVSLLDAVRGGSHATNQEEHAIRRMFHQQVQGVENELRSSLRSMNSRAETLRKEIANAKSKKTQQGYIDDLAKIERQRKKVLDLRDVLNKQEDRAQKYLANLNDHLDKLAARREKIAERLSRAQNRLATLRDAKAQIEESVRTGIAGFTDVTSVVPQGVKITAARIVSGMAGRLQVVKQWAADIKTLIKRGLNKTMITEIINQGPDVGGQYARVLVGATDAQISSLNQTQKQITSISNNLATYVGNAFYDVGIKAAQGLIKALKNKQGELDAVAAEMGRKMATALKKALGIKSPSAVFRDEIGQFIPRGVAQGIERSTPHAVAAIHRMNRKLMAASQVAMTPDLAARVGNGAGSTTITSPLIHIDHFHVRDDSDIDKLENMLYRSHQNISRAAGKRQVVPTS